MSLDATLPSVVLDEAAEWLLRLHSGEATDADRCELDLWREVHPHHERAWQLAQVFLQGVHRIPPPLGRYVLEQPASSSRRRAVRQLALLSVAGPAVWLVSQLTPWRTWSADYRTATGEQHTVTLKDGTQLVLNTASAVDVRFDEHRRVLHLRAGEIRVNTGHDASGRPFFVETAEGSAQAIGTRFVVRQHAERSEVAVFDGAVDLRPGGSPDTPMRLQAGDRGTWTRYRAEPPVAARASAELWTQGMLVAENLRLQDLVAELDRYRSGSLRCDPAVADLRISGAFPLSDIAQSLRLIQDILPVQVRSPLPYRAVIEPRA